MTLDEAVTAFEADFDVVDEIGFPLDVPIEARDRSKSPTGESYVSWTHAGEKPENARIGWRAKSEDEAVEAWLAAVRVYAKQKQGAAGDRLTLYWRERPELDTEKKVQCSFVVYSRLVLSSLPRPTVQQHGNGICVSSS